MENEGFKIKIIRADNEIFKYWSVRELLLRKGTRSEPSPSNTQALNGMAEVTAGIIFRTARCMTSSSRLPALMWPVIVMTAVYLNNRSPKQQKNWQTPIGLWNLSRIQSQGIQQEYKPSLDHLKVYGCLAYTMTADAQLKRHRLQRLEPRVNIGWLVGYTSTNIYRIWIPKLRRIVSMRDVLFDEGQVYDDSFDPFPLQDREVVEDYVQHSEIVEEEPESDESDLRSVIIVQPRSSAQGDFLAASENDQIPLDNNDDDTMSIDSRSEVSYDTSATPYSLSEEKDLAAFFSTVYGGGECSNRSSEEKVSEEANFEDGAGRGSFAALSSEDGADTATIRNRYSDLESQKQPFLAAFHAGSHYKGRIGKQKSSSGYEQLAGQTKIHRSELPPPPTSFQNLSEHALGERFREAQQAHLQSHISMGTWTEVIEPQGVTILDNMWVYVYKLDKHGYLVKCKARIVIRGDQEPHTGEGAYAATLAGRAFRTMCAVITKYDLETGQFDAVNAFAHTDINGTVYMRMPTGFRKKGIVCLLKKALFGLRRSPLLWQKDLTKELTNLGYKTVPHEPCAMMKDGVLVFFYVDDLVFCFKENKRKQMNDAVQGLRRRFHLEGGSELQWFLGIEVIRNRPSRRMWLSQESYISKMTGMLDGTISSRKVDTPMGNVDLLPYTGTATKANKKAYQQRTGTVMYAAVMTRPDVAFTVSRLSRYNSNPGPSHEASVQRLIRYLLTTKEYALELRDGNGFRTATDAAFADDSRDRKISQGFVMTLFGGTIHWRATKQATVTTSSTEAELLSLSYTAKEALYMSRLLNDLDLPEKGAPTIECDNKQTIRLIQNDINALQTQLRHVDIHNHWLRQEAKLGNIKIN